MSNQYETCKERFIALKDWYVNNKAKRNEATTRLHVIDTFLFECLGWDKRSDCITEEYWSDEYTDYTLQCPRRIMIVEAKKEGIYFDIPKGYSPDKKYKISTLKEDVPNLGTAINQVASYCQQRGTPYAVVTNGHQLVCFIGSRQDGLAPEKGQAIVFDSFDSMVENFKLLWDILSKPGVMERNLQKKLFERDTPILPQKLSMTISHYPGVKNRNILQTDLQILADLVFEDIISAHELEEPFLEKCYCQSGALSQYALISKSLLSKRYEALFSENDEHPTLVAAIDKKGISPELIAESFSRRPILILGDVGVGKTIFFRHFIHVDAKEIFENALVIYLDFGSKAAFSKDIRDFVLEEVVGQLLTMHDVDIFENRFIRRVYHGELIRFSKGIYGPLKESNPTAYQGKEIEFLEQKLANKEQHVILSLELVTKEQKKQIIIFLDNADQRSDEIQQQVFIIAQSIAATWSVTAFLALRPETFHRSKQLGSMSAYHLKAFTIAPPRIDHVLDKRLGFGLDIATGKTPLSALPSGVGIDFEKVGAFLSIVQQSLKHSNELVEFVDNLSGGNVRLALDFIKRLIGSGHINTHKILEIYNKSGRYFIALHEFFRSVIYGDSIYYDPDSSPIINLFGIITPDPKEHFISLITLQYIVTQGNLSKRHGFVDLQEIYNRLQGLGFSIPQIDDCLFSLCRGKLVETAGRVKPIERTIDSSALRITTIGAYHLQRLPYMFAYYDAVIMDVIVLNRVFREKISDVHDIEERLARCEYFLEYLDTCAKEVSMQNSGLNWQVMVQATRKNIQEIQTSITARKQQLQLY